MKLGRIVLRGVVGGLFVGHGTQKLFGWFDGHGIDATAGMFDQIGLRPGRVNAYAAGVSEAAGGALLAAGAATPLAAAALIGTMITAIRTVHWRNGVWVTNQGYEYNLVLIAACLALAEGGPGEFSIDHARGRDEPRPLTALAALALGAVASTAVIEATKRQPEPPATSSEHDQAPTNISD